MPSLLPSILGQNTVSTKKMHINLGVGLHECISNKLLHERSVIQDYQYKLSFSKYLF